MANWYGMSRSNYFAVKDAEKFEEAMSKFDCTVIAKTAADGTALYGFTSDDEYGSIPQILYDDDDNDLDDPISILDVIPEHLAEGAVCVVMEAGAEKTRYATGLAFALHSDGRRVRISLSDIYAAAAKEFGIDVSQITEATY